MLESRQKDHLAIALLVMGVALAVLSTFLPVLQVEGRNGTLSMSTWQVLPWFTKLKFLALALLLAAAFMTRLHKWRMAIAVAAVFMVFIPALSSFISAIYAWGTLRAEIAQMTGQRSPFVHPGLANVVLVVAGVMVSYAVWRFEKLAHPAPAVAAS